MIKAITRVTVGGRVRLTVISDNEVSATRKEPSRFEFRGEQVHVAGKHDPDGVIVIRFEKLAPAEYNLKRQDRVYFDAHMRKWFAVAKDDREVIFTPELVGVLYQHNRDELERFGFVIAGHDLRHVLFHVLYENRKDLLQQPFAIAQAVCKKGDELCEYAKTMLVEHNDWFAPEERDLINEYLRTR